MEILLSVFLGELTTRSIDFLVRKCSTKPSAPELEDRLRRVMLRAQVIADEALGRHITNPAMLLQLSMLRDGVHQGHYMLDTSRCQYSSRDDAEATTDTEGSRKALALSRASSSPSSILPSSSRGKGRFRYSSSSSSRNAEVVLLEGLTSVLQKLSSMVDDAGEMVAFLTSYPRLHRQPYSMHVQLGNCMFGRQMEAELVVGFLLHSRRGPTHGHGSSQETAVEVLPIVGPGRVGKSTLVAHVCKDERVRAHFSEIIFLKEGRHGFTDDDLDLATLGEGCATEHQDGGGGGDGMPRSSTNEDGRRSRRLLLVVELSGDLDDDAWNKLCFAAAKRRMVPSNDNDSSKVMVIVTSRSEKVTRFGTAAAVRLQNLSHEAFWYFFKTLAFGGTDPAAGTTHASSSVRVAMEIAGMLGGCLVGANITADLLRDNCDVRFWRKVLAFLRGVVLTHRQPDDSGDGDHPFDLISDNRLAHLGRMAAPSTEDLVLYHQDQRSPQEEVPDLRIQDVMYGSARPSGRFEALAWRSPIPPYYSYVNTCEIRDLKLKGRAAAKRKRCVV